MLKAFLASLPRLWFDHTNGSKSHPPKNNEQVAKMTKNGKCEVTHPFTCLFLFAFSLNNPPPQPPRKKRTSWFRLVAPPGPSSPQLLATLHGQLRDAAHRRLDVAVLQQWSLLCSIGSCVLVVFVRFVRFVRSLCTCFAFYFV